MYVNILLYNYYHINIIDSDHWHITK